MTTRASCLSELLSQLGMECSSSWGVLGVPVSLECASQQGTACCTVTQLFARVVIEIPPSLVASWTASTAGPVKDAEFSEEKVILKSSDGGLHLEARPWAKLEPRACDWRFDKEGMQLILAKARSSLGSWPHALQSLALRPPDAPAPLPVCDHDKAAFDSRADEILESHLAEAQAVRAVFAQAVADQMATVPSGPLGQAALLFPQPGPHCVEFIRACSHLAAVQKLLRLTQDLTGVAVLGDGDSGGALRSLLSCLVAGLAGVEKLRADRGIEIVRSIDACVGLGAGEYAAAVFAGVLRLPDALAAVRAHAAALERSNDDPRSGNKALITAVRTSLRTLDLRDPRLRLYSSSDGTVCSSAVAVVAALPHAVSGADLNRDRISDLKLALNQQGVAEITVLVGEKGAPMADADADEAEAEEANEGPRSLTQPPKTRLIL